MIKFDVKIPNLKVSRDELISELQELSSKLGKKEISIKDIEEHSKYSHSTYRNYFGTLRSALQGAGLTSTRNWGTSKEEYFNNIMTVWIALGCQPKLNDMNNKSISKHSSSSYIHVFGSWTKVLMEFQNFINNRDSQGLVIDKPINKDLAIGDHTTSRFPNLSLRFKILQRDNFKCCACGASPAKDPSVELQVDHIIPWSKGGETVMENLQTLCSKCNLGKSNLL